MKAAGIRADMGIYCSLFAKSLDGVPLQDILEVYTRKVYPECEPLNALIASLHKARRVLDALKIALNQPQLSSARRLMRRKPKDALRVFQDAKDQQPRHPTADLALGTLYLEHGDHAKARRHLLEALPVVPHPTQKATIQEWLMGLEGNHRHT